MFTIPMGFIQQLSDIPTLYLTITGETIQDYTGNAITLTITPDNTSISYLLDGVAVTGVQTYTQTDVGAYVFTLESNDSNYETNISEGTLLIQGEDSYEYYKFVLRSNFRINNFQIYDNDNNSINSTSLEFYDSYPSPNHSKWSRVLSNTSGPHKGQDTRFSADNEYDECYIIYKILTDTNTNKPKLVNRFDLKIVSDDNWVLRNWKIYGTNDLSSWNPIFTTLPHLIKGGLWWYYYGNTGNYFADHRKSGMRYFPFHHHYWMDSEIRPNTSSNSNDDNYIGYVFQDANSVGGPEFTLKYTSENPMIAIKGDSYINIESYPTTYTDAGAIALDYQGNDISSLLVVSNQVDGNTEGLYTVTYNVTDSGGRVADEVVRTVRIGPEPQSYNFYRFVLNGASNLGQIKARWLNIMDANNNPISYTIDYNNNYYNSSQWQKTLSRIMYDNTDYAQTYNGTYNNLNIICNCTNLNADHYELWSEYSNNPNRIPDNWIVYGGDSKNGPWTEIHNVNLHHFRYNGGAKDQNGDYWDWRTANNDNPVDFVYNGVQIWKGRWTGDWAASDRLCPTYNKFLIDTYTYNISGTRPLSAAILANYNLDYDLDFKLLC